MYNKIFKVLFLKFFFILGFFLSSFAAIKCRIVPITLIPSIFSTSSGFLNVWSINSSKSINPTPTADQTIQLRPHSFSYLVLQVFRYFRSIYNFNIFDLYNLVCHLLNNRCQFIYYVSSTFWISILIAYTEQS